LIKEHPVASDRTAIEGKFKSYHNVSDLVAGLMTKTFFDLVALSDLTTKTSSPAKGLSQPEPIFEEPTKSGRGNETPVSLAGLHYNIQIHLPPTKDVEVYNAIFKSLKEHLLDD
jgi:hypothetical protein